MTIHYNAIIINGILDGVSRLDLSQATQQVAFAPDFTDERSLLFTINGGTFGVIAPRQDVQQAGRALQRNANAPPLDVIQRATKSPRERGGVPAIDDFLLHHLELVGVGPAPPSVRIVNAVTTAVWEDLTSLLVNGATPNDWNLPVCRVIPTGHVLTIAAGGGPANYRVACSLDPLDGPDVISRLCAGSGGGVDTICCNPIVADVWQEGPVPGPYVTAADPPIVLPAGFPAPYLVRLYTQHFNASGNVFILEHPNLLTVGTLVIAGWVYTPGGAIPPQTDQVDVTLDLSACGSGVRALVLENDCGCRGMISLNPTAA